MAVLFYIHAANKTGLLLKTGEVVWVDPEDVEKVSDLPWSLNAYGYPVAWKRPTSDRILLFLHREILRASKGQIVDHRNGRKTDCRKKNLRFATKTQNGQNRVSVGKANKSGRTGVHLLPTGKWTAQIRVSGKVKHLGNFTEFTEAVAARISAEAEFFGSYAPKACRGVSKDET